MERTNTLLCKKNINIHSANYTFPSYKGSQFGINHCADNIFTTMLEEIFNLQSKEEQAAYTWEFGTFLATRLLGKHIINLYQVDDFYAEVWYAPEKKSVYGVKSYSSDRCFAPYLDEIVIAF